MNLDTEKAQPLKRESGNDNDILFGEISEHMITSLNTVINAVYKPMVEKLDPIDWVKCEDE